MHRSIILGFMAPPIGKQFPELDDYESHLFDQDNETLNRLRIRRIITDAELNKARARLIKKIERELRRVRKDDKE